MDYDPDKYPSIWDYHGARLMNKNMLMLIARQAAQLVPEVKQYLKPETIKALNSYEGVRNDYWASVYDAVEGYLRSDRPITSYRSGMYNAMNSAFQTAFEYGYTEAGGEVPIDAEAQEWLDGAIAGERGNIANLFQTLKDGRGELDAVAEGFARADGYSSTLDQIYSTGKTYGAKNMMLTFVGDDGKESCTDCKRLKGQRHRASWWISKDLIPGSSNYECGGWNCEHYLEDDKGNRFTI